MNIKRKIAHGFRWFMPYGIVRWYERRKESQSDSFWTDYLAYLRAGEFCEFAKESPVKYVVSPIGLGYSGSGAVADLLREYKTTVVIAGVDKVGSLAAQREHSLEVDFLRVAGGLFEFEKYLDSHNFWEKDALLHRFMLLIQYSELYIKVPKTRKYFYEFFRHICVYFGENKYQVNWHLNYDGMKQILYMKQMSVEEYRSLCRHLLYSIFGCFNAQKNELLILDQFVSDLTFDFSKYVDYIPNVKPIVVYRDPRDVYVFAKEQNIDTIPTSSVEKFIDWYQLLYSHLDVSNIQGFYVTSFEKLIKEYDTTVDEIEDFLLLDKTMHIYPKQKFDPSVSGRGVGLWKNHPELSSDMNKIEYALTNFIYYK